MFLFLSVVLIMVLYITLLCVPDFFLFFFSFIGLLQLCLTHFGLVVVVGGGSIHVSVSDPDISLSSSSLSPSSLSSFSLSSCF